MQKDEIRDRRLRLAFRTFDADGTGTINRTGFFDLVRRLGAYVPSRQFDAEWRELATKEDDGEESIHFETFSTWWASRRRRRHPIAALMRAKLSVRQFVRNLMGSDLTLLTRRGLVVSRKVSAMRRERKAFRKRIPPPFSCKVCMRTFLSKWHMKHHKKHEKHLCDVDCIAFVEDVKTAGSRAALV